MLDTFIKVIQMDLTFYQDIGLLLFSLIFSCLISIPRKHQPLNLFNLLAKKFSVKVNNFQRSPQQRVIAGTLTAIILVLPIWFIIVFFINLAAYPWFFETLLLFFCLNDNGLIKESKTIAVLIHSNKTQEAKLVLGRWCQRDTSPLSAVGLTKACIETLAKFSSITSTLVVFSFLAGGIETVLLLMLLKQLNFAWPHSNERYRYFGTMIFIVNKIFCFIPYSCFLFIFSFSSRKSLRTLFHSIINKSPNMHSF